MQTDDNGVNSIYRSTINRLNEDTDPGQALRKRIASLEESQLKRFKILIADMRAKTLNNNLYTFQTHIAACVNICKTLNAADIDIENGCWLSQITKDKFGYCDFKLTNIAPFHKGCNQGTRLYQVEGSKQKNIKIHRYTTTFAVADDSLLEAAHRCNKTNCCNPKHIKYVSSAENKDDKGCRYGCANYCPHTPTCIWTHDNGSLKPCRMNPTKAVSKEDCKHNPSCF